ncbi:MAG: gephyrin-like molybdotransferase Glp [Bacteroidia bacterium]
MLTVKEAKQLLFNSIKQLPAVKKRIEDCLGCVLAQNILSPYDSPQFNQSAMDGFAVRVDDLPEGDSAILEIVGEVKAGDKPVNKLKNNTAIYLYTGSAVPVNATAVVIQEKVTVDKNLLSVPVSIIKLRSNIRYKATQIRKGELALEKGTVITASGIGWLCSMGLKEIKVISKPKVSILATGNELRKPGEKLLPGQIYESNSYMLNAALHETGFNASQVKSVADNEKLIYNNIEKMLKASDVAIITGGISVGKYDFVKETLKKLGVKELFYKVSQKPGKPLFVGIKGKFIVFALPGNPASALVCFYQYVLPAMRKMSGHKNIELKKEFIPLADNYELKSERDLFLKAKVTNGIVELLGGQESNILKSFAEANALVFFEAGNRGVEKGEMVEVYLLA